MGRSRHTEPLRRVIPAIGVTEFPPASRTGTDKIRGPLSTLFVLAAFLGLAGCENKAEVRKPEAQAALITATRVQHKKLEVLEETVGSLESLIDPKLSAEVAGRVIKVSVASGQEVKAGQFMAEIDPQDLNISRQTIQAEVNRIEALLANQKRIVERNQRLVQSNFISQNAVDDAVAQEKALREQLAGARSQLAQIERNIGKTRVVAPMDARVETQIVAVGDYVKVGDPLFQVVSVHRLRAHLPFPERIAPQLKLGLEVRLTTPTAPDQPVSGVIEDIKPMVGANNRAVDVIVRVNNAGGWKPGASVNGAVVVAEHPNALMVPEQSVVLRPAGRVVYVITDGKALQRVVTVGAKQAGMIEITSGLEAGETVAVDGAGFLTDQAPVTLKREKSADGKGNTPGSRT